MKASMKILIVCVVFLAGVGFGADGDEDQELQQWQKGREERKICRELAKAVVSWLADANEAAGAQSDRLADSLLQLQEPSVKAYFIAAQVANLRGKPNKAIQILEAAVAKYPDDKAPIGLVVPVKIVGRLWIATIARQSRDMGRAKELYDATLKTLKRMPNIKGVDHQGGLMMICHFHLAEIESEHLKDNAKALSHLKAIEEVKTPEPPLGMGYETYKSWAMYERARISTGGARTGEMRMPPDMTSAVLTAVTQLELTGLTAKPLSEYQTRESRGRIMGKTVFDRAIQSGVSRMDANLVRLVYGYVHQQNKEYDAAEKYYSVLFVEDSFFSPVAGVQLATCKKARGQRDEAEKIFEQVTAKYPASESIVTKVRQSWK